MKSLYSCKKKKKLHYIEYDTVYNQLYKLFTFVLGL